MSSFQADHISNLRKEYKQSGDRMMEDDLISKDPYVCSDTGLR